MVNNKLEIKNLCVNINEKKILENISFCVEPKKSVCIIGKGSSGKTVLLKSILGLIPIYSGKVLVNNLSLFEKKLINKNDILDKFGVVFQKDALFDSLTVWENIMFKEINMGKKDSELISKSEVLLKKVRRN